jgi:hypothetical protein
VDILLEESTLAGFGPAWAKERLKALERENRELRQANEFRRKASDSWDSAPSRASVTAPSAGCLAVPRWSDARRRRCKAAE